MGRRGAALVSLALCLAPAGPAAATMVGYNDDAGRMLGVPRLVRNSHTQVARVGFGWQAIEPLPGRYEWDRVDAVIGLLRAAGIRPILAISGAPAWAGPPDPPLACGCDVFFDQAWQAIWRQVAARYPGVVLNTLNEPNLEAFGNLPADRAAELANLAANAVWRVDPARTVVGPPIGPVAEWRQYARRLYPRLDPRIAMAANLYPHGHLIENVRADLATVRRTAAGRPIWITETNVSRLEVGESRQARYIRAIYSLAERRPQIRAVVYHRLWSPYRRRDADHARDAGMSALSARGRPLPMYEQIRRLHGGRR